MTALSKKNGGVHPIAVGCTLRRLVAKVVSGLVSGEMSSLLAPRQLGYDIPGGVEAAVHSARYFLRIMDSNSAFLKLDFRNAFNSVRCDKMLTAVKVCSYHFPVCLVMLFQALLSFLGRLCH